MFKNKIKRKPTRWTQHESYVNLIKYYMKVQKVTITEMARFLEVHPSQLSRWLHNKNCMSRAYMLYLDKVLELEEEE